MNENKKILLIDDHPTVRQGLQFLLEMQDHKVMAQTGCYEETLELLTQNTDFDIAILDLTLKDKSGLDLVPALDEQGIAVIVYTMHEDPGTIKRVLKTDILGYVTKREEPETLFEAINTASKGSRFISPYACKQIKTHQSKQQYENVLTDREREVFIMMGNGLGNAEISNCLDISPRTVETYYTRMTAKLGCKNRRELRKFAVEEVQKNR